MLSAEPRYRSVGLLVFFLLSLLIHLALGLVLPDLTRLFKIHLNRLALLNESTIEVDLVKVQVEPLPLPPEPEEKPQLLNEAGIAALIDHRLERPPALGEGFRLPRPPLPRLEQPRPEASLVIVEAEKTASLNPRELLGGFGRAAAGRLSGRRFEGRLENNRSQEEVLLSPAAARRLLTLVGEQPAPARQQPFSLAGPVARQRQLLFQPPLPVVSLVRDVTVDFRFWVRPDGSVGRVETTRIGDLEVVNVAERFLRQWRFSTLSPEFEQVEQWGTVTLVFRVPR